jgi:hypothetical protein
MKQKTIFEHLHDKLNDQIEDNLGGIYKTDPITREKVAPTQQELKNDADHQILENMHRRKRNILEREGD